MKEFALFSAGLALCSILFGSGSIVLKLMLGDITGLMASHLLAGFVLGAIMLPAIKHIVMMIVTGKYINFFMTFNMLHSTCLSIAGIMLQEPSSLCIIAVLIVQNIVDANHIDLMNAIVPTIIGPQLGTIFNLVIGCTCFVRDTAIREIYIGRTIR